MKLTESQLKRIIAEEVQNAIDEGLFDFVRGAGRAAGDAFSGAVNKVFAMPHALTADAITNAVYAARRDKDKRLIQKAGDLANQLAKHMEQISIIGLPETEAANLSFFETLAASIGSNVEDLPKFKRQVEKETLVGTAERPDNASRSAIEMSRRRGMGPVASRIGPSVRPIPGYGSIEEQAEAITEAILKRIIQKR